MQLGFNTNGLQNHRLHEAIRLMADHGFEAVALTPDVMHLDPYRSTVREIESTAALLSRLRMSVVIETGARFVLDPATKHAPTLMTRDPQERDRRLDYYQRCARIGRDLGARVLSFWTGTRESETTDDQGWMLDGLQRTSELVVAAGLQPALEPEPGMAVETCAQFAALSTQLGAAAPGLCLDVGHLLVTGEGQPDDVIAEFGDRLLQVHLEDMRRGEHVHLPPGEGDVDFGAVRRALESVGYRGPVCFELSRDAHRAPQMLQRCRDTWDAAR